MGTFANSETADSSGQVNVSASVVGYKCKKTLSQPACFFIVVLIIEGCPPRGWNSSSWGRDVKTRGGVNPPHPPNKSHPVYVCELSGLCLVFVCAFTLYPFRAFIMILSVCHCFLPVSSPLCVLVPAMCFPVFVMPCAFPCLFIYAKCFLVVVPVSPPLTCSQLWICLFSWLVSPASCLRWVSVCSPPNICYYIIQLSNPLCYLSSVCPLSPVGS